MSDSTWKQPMPRAVFQESSSNGRDGAKVESPSYAEPAAPPAAEDATGDASEVGAGGTRSGKRTGGGKLAAAPSAPALDHDEGDT